MVLMIFCPALISALLVAKISKKKRKVLLKAKLNPLTSLKKCSVFITTVKRFLTEEKNMLHVSSSESLSWTVNESVTITGSFSRAQ